MAEFLVNKNESWLSYLTDRQLNQYRSRFEHFQQKYDLRKRVGDIVNITENGFWDKASGWGKHAYYLIKIPGLFEVDAKHYMSSATLITTPKFRFRFNLNNLSEGNKAKLSRDEFITLTILDAHRLIEDKEVV